MHTPWFIKHSSISKELISILPYINGPFITLGPFPAEDAFQGSIAAYAAIYYNINSTAGYNYIQANPQHWRNIQILGINVAKKDCNGIYEYLIKTKTTDSLAYGETCSLLESCGLYKKIKKEDFCLYKTKK